MEVKIFKAFIASPSDTNRERELCDKVFMEISSSLGSIYNFRIESLKWEADVRPSIQETDGQSLIFEQIGDTYEIFVGIMNKKFGSPTLKAGSGTEEEFNAAFDRRVNRKDIEVVFYFNDEPPKSMSDIDTDELVKIYNFKKKLQPHGLYGTYNGSFDFEEKLRKNITKYFIEEYREKNNTPLNAAQLINKEALRKIFKKRLNDSLKGFDDQPHVWTEPVISRTRELSQDPDNNYCQRVVIEELLLSEKSYIINAPSQFGLTTLGHYLVSEAWENDELWIYLDNSTVKPHKIYTAIKYEALSLDQPLENVKCIVFDTYYEDDKVSRKKLKNLIESNPHSRIIVLSSVDEILYTDRESDQEEVDIEKKFESLHLIALPRNQIRQIVTQYNSIKRIGDENVLLDKITSELESLNLHRTPYNVVTILKVSERYYDDSPVNRTKMIEMILFVLFDLGELPVYKVKPDLKDCEYVLGRFCEIMIKNDCYTFIKDNFINELKKFCSEKLIDLDIEVVFNVLTNNSIIVNSGFGKHKFKSSFWIYYFGAKRMHNDESFKNYIFSSQKYSSFPEIIEFYTGIDRNRDDALKILLTDIRLTKSSVEEKLGIKDEINPLHLAQWKPTEEQIEKMQNELSENVLTSNLPDAIKDKYLDKSYNQIKPYDQSIRKILEDYSLVTLMHQIKASSTALRNSDYSNPEIKKELLDEIYRSWSQLAQILFALSPIMAMRGNARFDGQGFKLSNDISHLPFEKRLNLILQATPTNVVGYFKDDLFSPKIAPLLYDHFSKEESDLMKHHQALFFIFKRPNGWKKHIENYIVSINKNSFYLFNTVNALRTKFKYDFASDEELSDIKYLAKLGVAKHHFGGKKPGIAQIVQIPDTYMPEREAN